MSFNRIKYDNCAYNLQMNRSTQPGDYRLYSSYAENKNQCLSYDGPIGSKVDVSIVKNPLDLSFKEMSQIESQLSWRNNLLTKCNDSIKSIKLQKIYHKPYCNKKLTHEDTRFTHPLDNYRGMSLTNYQLEPYIYINPQCHIQEASDRSGLSSRLHTKYL